MSYVVMDTGGFVEGSFTTEDEARAYVKDNPEREVERVLVRFGYFANDNEVLERWPPAKVPLVRT